MKSKEQIIEDMTQEIEDKISTKNKYIGQITTTGMEMGVTRVFYELNKSGVKL